MKTLKAFNEHPTRCSKATGWRTYPGYFVIEYTDGTGSSVSSGELMSSGVSLLDYLEQKNVDTSAYRQRCQELEAKIGYPAKPEKAELYYRNYAYEKPIELGAWGWSTTFMKWGRTVTFEDGKILFTYPKPESN